MTVIIDQYARLVLSLAAADVAAIEEGTARLAVASDEPFNEKQLHEDARRAIGAAWQAMSEFTENLRDLIDHPPYFAVIKGIILSDPIPFFVALTRSLGELAEPYQKNWSRTIHSIRPQTDRPISGLVLNQKLHTDGTHWPRPNDLTCLLCRNPDQNGGGSSRLLPVDALIDELSVANRSLLDVLSREPLPWQIDQDLGGDIAWAPVFSASRMRWLKHTVTQTFLSGMNVTGSILAVLDEFETYIETSPSVAQFALQAGELLVVNNKMCMHARTRIPDVVDSHRWICRIKVNR